jgi:hypothetical protein
MNETSLSGGVVSKFVVFMEFELLDNSRIVIVDDGSAGQTILCFHPEISAVH